MAGLHNQQMEVGDRLGDLEAGRCRCRDLVVGSPPDSPASHPMSPSLSAVQGEGDKGVGVVPIGAAMENKIPIPIVVHGQQAHWAVHFRLNTQPASGREGEVRMHGDPAALRSLKHQGGGRSLQRRRGGRGRRSMSILGASQRQRMRLPVLANTS